jgi:hypothetical protein
VDKIKMKLGKFVSKKKKQSGQFVLKLVSLQHHSALLTLVSRLTDVRQLIC